MAGLSIGILVDSVQKHQHLGNMVVQAGHKVGYGYVLAAESKLPSLDQSVDAWVVDLGAPDEGDSHIQSINALLNELLGQKQMPVILNDCGEFTPGTPAHQDWTRRILERLERLQGDINRQTGDAADEVWVLGASTGGPAAVKDFLRELPPALNVAFVYVQHIDTGQADTLIKMMGSADYPAVVAGSGTLLRRNSLTLITAERSVHIHENGTLVVRKNPWAGSYAPSIDQVAANVARVYRQRSGIIIFSGMGDDGAASCRLIRQQGGKVWVQTPSVCTISSMPDCAIATGAVSFIGTPAELADEFSRLKAPGLGKLKPYKNS